MEDLERAEKKTPGLWVCGNYRSGVAFPDCVEFGYSAPLLVAPIDFKVSLLYTHP